MRAYVVDSNCMMIVMSNPETSVVSVSSAMKRT